MSELRKYLMENQHAFDTEEPQEGHFERFSQKLQGNSAGSKRKPIIFFLRAAAVTVLMVLSSLWVYDHFLNPNYKDGIRLSEISKEYQEVEIFYTSQVNSKIDEISSSAYYKDSLHKKLVSKELKELDQLYNSLQLELKENPNDQRIIHAMIQHYQLKLEVLNQIMYHLNELSVEEITNKHTNHDSKNI